MNEEEKVMAIWLLKTKNSKVEIEVEVEISGLRCKIKFKRIMKS